MEPFPVSNMLGMMIGAYLLGSIPCGLVLTRFFTSVDLLKQGSGNIGATNVRRLAGSALGFMTLIGDVLKGMVPVLIAKKMLEGADVGSQMVLCAVALSSFLGHLFPLYLKFRHGGKGVATTFGCFLVISPWGCLACLLVFTIAIFASNRASVGSLCAAGLLPLVVLADTDMPLTAAFAMVFTGMIFLRHKDNIRRILRGVEPVIWKKKE